MVAALIASIASLLPGLPEMVVILVIGLLLFGRDLPAVGKVVGRTIMQFRQGLQKFKDELSRDQDLQDVSATVRDLGAEVRGARHRISDSVRSAIELPPEVKDVTAALQNPGSVFEGLTDETAATHDAQTGSVPTGADDPLQEPTAARTSPLLQAARRRKA